MTGALSRRPREACFVGWEVGAEPGQAGEGASAIPAPPKGIKPREPAPRPIDAGVDIGHVHLKAARLDEGEDPPSPVRFSQRL